MSVLRSWGCWKIWQPHSVISQDSAEIRGNKEQCSCYVTNRFPHLNSRSAGCCHISAVLFTQTYRFSPVVISHFQIGRAAISSNWKKDHSINDRISTSPLWCVPRWLNGANMWVWAYKSPPVFTPFSPRNQIVLLFCVSSAPKQCLEMPSAAGLRTGCMHRRAASSSNWLLCETKCEVICCDQNPGQTRNSLQSHREEKGLRGTEEERRGQRVKRWKLRVLSSSALYQFSLCSPAFLLVPLPLCSSPDLCCFTKSPLIALISSPSTWLVWG